MSLFVIGCIIATLCSLPAVAISIKRLFVEKNIAVAFLFLVTVAITATFISACFHYDNYMVCMKMGENVIGNNLNPNYVSILIFTVSVVLNIGIYILAIKATSDNLWKCITALLIGFLIVNIIVGGVVSFLTNISIEKCFFGSCCASMGIGGMAWGLSYREICVIFNIYIQSVVCLVSALWLTWVLVKRYFCRRTLCNTLLMFIGSIYGILFIYGFLLVCFHYAMPLTDAYNLCYHEMVQLAKGWHTTYNNANYIIFIILFLIVTIGNIVLARFLKFKN